MKTKYESKQKKREINKQTKKFKKFLKGRLKNPPNVDSHIIPHEIAIEIIRSEINENKKKKFNP